MYVRHALLALGDSCFRPAISLCCGYSCLLHACLRQFARGHLRRARFGMGSVFSWLPIATRHVFLSPASVSSRTLFLAPTIVSYHLIVLCVSSRWLVQCGPTTKLNATLSWQRQMVWRCGTIGVRACPISDGIWEFREAPARCSHLCLWRSIRLGGRHAIGIAIAHRVQATHLVCERHALTRGVAWQAALTREVRKKTTIRFRREIAMAT